MKTGVLATAIFQLLARRNRTAVADAPGEGRNIVDINAKKAGNTAAVANAPGEHRRAVHPGIRTAGRIHDGAAVADAAEKARHAWTDKNAGARGDDAAVADAAEEGRNKRGLLGDRDAEVTRQRSCLSWSRRRRRSRYCRRKCRVCRRDDAGIAHAAGEKPPMPLT